MINNAHELLQFYKDHLQHDLMVFWRKAFDSKYGGVYTCFSNDGKTLLSKDKYIWSQGRMLWLLSRYAELIERGILNEDQRVYLEHAEKTYQFLLDNAVLNPEEGVCAYLCARDGTKKESIPGKGFYTSFYVDCFVIMGFAEYARVTGKKQPLLEALALYDRTRAYLARGEIVSEPYPIPDGFSSHSVPMIMTNVTFTLYDSLKRHGHARYDELVCDAQSYVRSILETHFHPERRLIVEMLPSDPKDFDTMLYKHVNAGHAIEGMWFCLKVVRDTGMDKEYPARIADVIKNSIEIGWDEEMGGLYRVVGEKGGKPEGRLIGDPFEQLLCDTWDSKLWWPHSEALYTTLLSCVEIGEEDFRPLYDKLSEYIFRVFLNPDREVGEWIQILDRNNVPMDKVVALPVKDPYHIMRNIILIIELLVKSVG